MKEKITGRIGAVIAVEKDGNKKRRVVSAPYHPTMAAFIAANLRQRRVPAVAIELELNGNTIDLSRLTIGKISHKEHT